MRASPRREFPWYLLPCMHFLDAELEISWKTVRAELAESVGVLLGAPMSVLAGRAMVAGMAMAFAAATDQEVGHAVNMPGNQDSRWTTDAADVNLENPADIGLVILSFTPLHKAVQGTLTTTYGMFVWGYLPR